MSTITVQLLLIVIYSRLRISPIRLTGDIIRIRLCFQFSFPVCKTVKKKEYIEPLYFDHFISPPVPTNPTDFLF